MKFSHAAMLLTGWLAAVPLSAAGAAEPPEEVQRIEELLAPAEITAEQGFCYCAHLRLGRAGDKGGRSLCVLCEDGRPLPLPRALHADIRTRGAGRYSHWTESTLYFSARDNSDPRTNGRKYTLVSCQRQRPRQHRETIVGAAAAYGLSTSADHPLTNRRLVLRNVDTRTAIAPRLATAGMPDLSSVPGMLAGILKPEMTEEQKALAIWQFLVDWRYHDIPAEGGDELHDPVKFLGVYGYGFCDDSAACFAGLCHAAGLRARVWGLSGHVVGEAFYDGGWHMFDPDHAAVYRRADGRIAGVEELAAHPELITRQPRDPIGADSASIARLYTTTADNRVQERKYPADHRLDMTLLPGDEVVFDFSNTGLVHRLPLRNAQETLNLPGAPLPPAFGNGRLTRRLQFDVATPAAEIALQWPYVILGGRLQLELAKPEARLDVAIAADAKTADPLEVQIAGTTATANLDAWFAAQRRAHYQYRLKITTGDGTALAAALRAATLTTTFQFAPRAIAQVRPGENAFNARVTWTGGDSGGPRSGGLEVTHEWDEVLGPLPCP